MTTNDDFFGLTDPAYFKPDLGLDPEPLARTLDRNFWGLALGGPRRVALDARSTLPMLVCHVETVRDLRVRNYARQTIVTAVDLRSGGLLVNMARNNDEPSLPTDLPAEPVEPDAPPPPDTSGDRASSLTTLDLRERLALDWRPARYLVTLILMDRVSHRVPVTLSATEGDFQDPEVERFIDAEYARVRPPLPYPPPADPVPRYYPWQGAPPVPATPGIVLSADRVSAIRADRRAMLFGTFRLPLLPRHVVRPDPLNPDPDQLAPWGGATAVMDIHLLLTGADRPGPVLLDLQVPSYDPIDPANPPADVTGYFAVDLLRTARMPHDAQTFFAYAFAGALMAGPVPLALVSADMLPRPY